MRESDMILAQREGYYSSTEERQRFLAEIFGVCRDPETGLAVISVEGVQGPSFFGPSSYSALRATVEGLLVDEDCKAIGIEFNSPGGDVIGLFEACSYLAQAKEEKPIHCHVTGMCCSAAYALAASCTDICATETSEVGSVGVYSIAVDTTEAEKKAGILTRIFRSKNAENKNKSAFTEEGAKERQERIDYFEDCFYTVLAEGRNMERDKCVEDFGHGSIFLATDALERNMIDSVASYDEWINGLTSSDEEEDEGDDMDITRLTAEEKSEVFKALVADNPSLLAEAVEGARTNERERVMGLMAQKCEANAEIIDKAIAEGSGLKDIAFQLYEVEKKRADELSAKITDPIAMQAEATQDLPELKNPMPADLGVQAKSIGKTITDARKKKEKKG